jgi:cobalt transporter subunit CbtA
MPLSGYAAFRRIVWAALPTALITGVVITLVQFATTVPLIAQAEVYERSAPVAQPRMLRTTGSHDQHEAHQGHGHAAVGDPGWAPDEGIERSAYTVLTTTLAAFGYALILGAALLQTRTAGLRAGLALGAAGFLTFQLAPALGLPAEPPGVPMAELLPRQAWWLGTVVATGSGLACWYFARGHSKRVWIPVGTALMILPHVVGAPGAPAEVSAVPDELVRRFSVMALLTAAMFWLMLGGLMGYVYGRQERREARDSA